MMPGSFNGTTSSYDRSAEATLLKTNGVPTDFIVTISLKGDFGQELLNAFSLHVVDEAGHESTYPVQITKDLKPPRAPKFCPKGIDSCV